MIDLNNELVLLNYNMELYHPSTFEDNIRPVWDYKGYNIKLNLNSLHL